MHPQGLAHYSVENGSRLTRGADVLTSYMWRSVARTICLPYAKTLFNIIVLINERAISISATVGDNRRAFTSRSFVCMPEPDREQVVYSALKRVQYLCTRSEAWDVIIDYSADAVETSVMLV
jgi:hypothetical protein